MKQALATLTLSVVAFVISIFPAAAFEDWLGDDVYAIPPALLFGDSVYGTSLSLAVTAILALILISAIVALAIMNRSDQPRR